MVFSGRFNRLNMLSFVDTRRCFKVIYCWRRLILCVFSFSFNKRVNNTDYHRAFVLASELVTLSVPLRVESHSLMFCTAWFKGQKLTPLFQSSDLLACRVCGISPHPAMWCPTDSAYVSAKLIHEESSLGPFLLVEVGHRTTVYYFVAAGAVEPYGKLSGFSAVVMMGSQIFPIPPFPSISLINHPLSVSNSFSLAPPVLSSAQPHHHSSLPLCWTARPYMESS